MAALMLDETDWALLRLLQGNGRMANKVLAQSVGLSASACHARVRRLEAVGAIEGYRAVLDWRLLGVHFEAWVELVVDAAKAEDFAAFLNLEAAIGSAQRLAQPNMFLVHVVAGSPGAWGTFLDAAKHAGFSLEVARFNLALGCVKPASIAFMPAITLADPV